MLRTNKNADVKATNKKTVKAAPAEEVQFAELVVEPEKKSESKPEVKKMELYRGIHGFYSLNTYCRT